MATTQSLPADFEHRAKRVTENHPFAGADEFPDTRVGKHAISVDAQNSTYLGVNSNNQRDAEQFLSQVTDKTIDYYAKLELYNRGTHNLKWTRNQSAKHDNDDFLFCDALTGQMGLSEWQRKAVWRLFKGMDMRSYKRFDTPPGEPEYKQYLVAFCIGALLYNENLPEQWSDWSYYPTKKNYPSKVKRYPSCPRARLRAQEMGDGGDGHRIIERVAKQMGFTDEQVNACYQKVRAELQAYLDDD